MISSRHFAECVFVALALVLLAMTLVWQIPMMLWDHLNLVPMLDAWRHGQLADSAFLRFDGGHMHTAAYAVLLLTARLTAGQPWLADTVSWLLLVASGALVMLFIRASFPNDGRRGRWLVVMLVGLALYPGHLANLQWGWQVAVFLCLLGVVGMIFALTRPRLSWGHNAIALIGAALACFSFATGIAALPVALFLLALRTDQACRRRLLLALPWLVGCGLLALVYRRFATAGMTHDVLGEIQYFLNFIGAGISRFATDLAAALAVAGIALAAWAAWRHWRERDALPWIGLASFGLLAGVLVALGRASALGADQAFVSRYVSFSSLFWLGLVALLSRKYRAFPARWLHVALIVIGVFAFGNALQMIHKAQEVSARTYATANTIRDTWPHVSEQLLGKIYFDKPRIARQRLALLHAWGYAPFLHSGSLSVAQQAVPK